MKRTLHVSSKRYCSCLSNIKFMSSRHRVISSIYPYMFLIIIIIEKNIFCSVFAFTFHRGLAPQTLELNELRNLNELQEFQTGGFTLKTHRMFCVHARPEKFQKAKVTGYFGFVFRENSGREINVFRPHQNIEPAFSNFFGRFKKRF